jgi:hypothetical protein
MSQRERQRRRLRQLTERDPTPVLVSCVPRDLGRRHFPPDVLAQTVEVACAGCHAPGLVHRPIFQLMESRARYDGAELLTLCQDCCTEATRGLDYTEVRFVDPALARRLTQWETEAN